jgi:aryl-alcohol dehydrogenase-like predicted oxidoreductase
MRQDKRMISQEEMLRRFAELRTVSVSANKTEALVQVKLKWEERKGHSISLSMMQTYYSLLQPRFERGDDLAKLAEVHTWSDIIWSLHGAE